MKVLIIHQSIPPNAKQDVADVKAETDHVKASLETYGHTVHAFGEVGTDMGRAIEMIKYHNPHVVFNLVEDVAGSNIMNPIGAMLCESIPIPFTGASSAALALTTNKVLTKRLLASAGLSTPKMITHTDAMENEHTSGRYIVKPISEDGSVGITDCSVMDGSKLRQYFISLADDSSRYFAEEYVDGREIFVPVIYVPDRKQMVAMSPAEFVYDNYPENKPKILNYNAKWDEESFEYTHTIKTFEFKPEESSMIEYLKFIAEKAVRLFGIKGYARVDFRVSDMGTPSAFGPTGKYSILEVNANPRISPESMMCDAAHMFGMSDADFMNAILEDRNGL